MSDDEADLFSTSHRETPCHVGLGGKKHWCFFGGNRGVSTARCIEIKIKDLTNRPIWNIFLFGCFEGSTQKTAGLAPSWLLIRKILSAIMEKNTEFCFRPRHVHTGATLTVSF